ncbi:hypothetical protein J1614_006421 [Plenodomus biglobosus]|nr:hypothetical protein J1614_006421 [Plenodomus biglobosus]
MKTFFSGEEPIDLQLDLFQSQRRYLTAQKVWSAEAFAAEDIIFSVTHDMILGSVDSFSSFSSFSSDNGGKIRTATVYSVDDSVAFCDAGNRGVASL